LREDDRSHGPTLHAPLWSRKREIDVLEGIAFAYSAGDGVLPVMTRRVLRARILAAAAGLVLAVCLHPAPSETTPPRAERPTYRIGETWALDRGVYELKRIDGDTYVFVAGPGKEIHLTKDLGVARVVLDGHADFDVAAPPKLSWPLTIGKWGSARALLRSSPPRPLHDFTGTINVLWRVEAYEDVTTTAGTFQAFRITYKLETVGTGMGSGQQFGQFSLWYAPGIERLVRAQGDVAAVNWALAKADRPAPPQVAASPAVRAPAPAKAPTPAKETDDPPPAVPPATPRAAPPRAAAVPPTPAAPTKVVNRWAVVIGIGEYENKRIPKLRFAVSDAEAMYRFLTTHGGYPRDNVLLLTDTSATKPTLINVKRALGDFLARQAGREDMVLIYFAGHGAPEVDMGSAEADGLSKYLVPRDADPDSLYTTALPMEEIQRIFARISSERIVMLLDTCYSGTAGGRTFARQQVRAMGLNDHFLERLARSQ
jgi:Caspase domain